ncbi:uncharacterized protein [Dendrobates tinctorius]|uniref:uncharacterized protein isoform X2 n=1 Tax=Dendrobates tinctorius TaxID=92724 RepID=UPI003CC9BE13
MKDICYLMCIIILLCIRSTEGTLLGDTENLHNDHNFKEAQVVPSTWEKEGDSHRKNHVVVAVPVIVVLLVVIVAGVAFIQWRKKKRHCANSREIPVEEARSDPEGKSGLEKEELKELRSNTSDDGETSEHFEDAKEYQEDEIKGGHTVHQS